MGDLIQKLPTDPILLSQEETETFRMLFPEEQAAVAPPQPNKPLPNPPHKLKKEVLTVSLFLLVFFVLNVPYVKTLITEYIPMCHKSWILTNLVQAILFAFILWIVLNAEYSRVS